MTEKRKNLYYLNELSDYKVSSEDPDVRGWDVKDKDNRVIGKVDNLLVNKEREQVVYLDVEVDETIIEARHDPYGTPASSEIHEFINKDGEEHIIIPVGLVSIDEDRKFVYTDRIDHQTFSETKRIEKGAPVERDYEVIVLESYDRFGDPDANRKDRDRYDEDLRERRRREDASFTENRARGDRDFETRPDDTYNDDISRREGRSRDVSFDDESDDRFDRDRGDDRFDRDRGDNRPSGRDYGDTRSREDYDTRRRSGDISDDDSFYDRREFDRTNWRRRR